MFFSNSLKFPVKNLKKHTKLNPVVKKYSPTLINRFRPISLLPVLSKVLEKIVSEQVNDYLNNNLILPILQSDFRARHSTKRHIYCLR